MHGNGIVNIGEVDINLAGGIDDKTSTLGRSTMGLQVLLRTVSFKDYNDWV